MIKYQCKQKEVIKMVTDAELAFWCVCGALALLFFLSMPLIGRYLDNKEAKSIFPHKDFEEYHDDMEDWQ